jgi:hypothetical protein
MFSMKSSTSAAPQNGTLLAYETGLFYYRAFYFSWSTTPV